MRIGLHIQKAIDESDRIIDLDPELEDVRAILDAICEILQDNEAAIFEISGASEADWPVDVRCDLSILLEQLPENLQKLRNDAPSIVFELYEQGIERCIRFERRNDRYAVTVTDWDGPIHAEIAYMDAQELFNMLESVRTNFLKLSDQIHLSDLARHELKTFLGSNH